MGPIDYSTQVQAPFQAALQGYQAGAAIRDDQQQQQALMAQRQAQLQQQADLAALVANPNAGPRDYAAMTVKYPALREQFKQSFGMLNEEQQKNELGFATQAYAAILSKRPDLAEKLVRDRAATMRASGVPDATVKQTELWADMLKTSPEQAQHLGGLMLAGVMGPEKFTETFGKLGTEARADQLQPDAVRKGAADATRAEAEARTAGVTADFARQQAQADIDQKAAQLRLTKAEVRNRASQLKLDGQKLQLETDKFLFEKSQKLHDIGQDGRKLVNDAAVTAGAAKLSADRANDLASRIDSIGTAWGSIGGWGEWIKKTTGSQDAITEMRTQYTALRNSEGVKNLPPGPASDNDVKMALDGIPPPTADPKVMQSWLRGVAKLNDISAAVENARADYAANNKGLLGRAKTSFQAGGTDVVAGDSWVQISKRVAEAAARKYTPEQDKVKPPSGAALIPGSGTPEAKAQDAQRAGQGAGREVSFNSLRD